MKILIVYENIPESTDFYVLDVTPKEWSWMKKCHKYFVNYDMPKANEKACNKLSEYLVDKTKLEYVAEQPFDVKALGIDVILHTGFGM